MEYLDPQVQGLGYGMSRCLTVMLSCSSCVQCTPTPMPSGIAFPARSLHDWAMLLG